MRSAPSSSGARAAVFVAALSVVAAVVGLGRDLVIAGYFGASSRTDAFVVAWTVPETAAPLLVDGAFAYVLVPLFTRQLLAEGSVRRAVDATFVPVVAALALLTLVIAAAAPLLVRALAPGIQDTGLATQSMQLAAPTVLLFGLIGYSLAGLRATGSFVLPALNNSLYSLGVIATIVALHEVLGVRSAALGLTIGALLALVVEGAAFLRRAGRPRLRGTSRAGLAVFAAFVPVAVWSLGRHAQVFVERVFGSWLDPGSISHLNYATKVGQLPLTLTYTVVMVGFPALVALAQDPDRKPFADAVTRAVRLVLVLVVPVVAALLVTAHDVVEVLYERGAFTPQDTAATADILRLYVLGVPGQTLAALLVLAFFAVPRTMGLPGRVAVAGLLLLVVIDVPLARALGAPGLALGNAIAITAMALALAILLARRVAPVDLTAILRHGARCVAAASVAGGCGLAARALLVGASLPPVLTGAASGLLLLGVFAVAAAALGVPEVRAISAATHSRGSRRD